MSDHDRIEELTPLSRLHIEAHRVVRAGDEEARRMMLNLPITEEYARRLHAHMEGLGEDCDLEEARAAVELAARHRHDGPHYGRDFSGEHYGETVTLRLAFSVALDVGEYLLGHEQSWGPNAYGFENHRRHVLDQLRSTASDEARSAIADLDWATSVRHAQARVELIWE